jgi:uncharacterized protein involved in exopolysaccharide biosynthesis
MLKSRTVADQLIEKFDLQKYFEQKYRMTTQTQLANASRISAGKEGIIAIAIELKDPKLAADVANAYVEELVRLTGVLAVTEASQRRLFFERQLSKARDNLAAAESAAREALSKVVEGSARLRAQITVKEVQIGAMRSFAADSNPDLQLVQRELASLRSELARAEGSGSAGVMPKSNAGASDNVRLLRELRYQEALQELLVRQTEAARLDEARDMSMIQVLDAAVVPDNKSSPNRLFFVFSASLCAGVILAFGIVLVHYIRESRARR